MLQDTASEVNAPSNDYWIGLVNVGDDTWTWLDGTELHYANWKDSRSRDDDDCITLHMEPKSGDGRIVASLTTTFVRKMVCKIINLYFLPEYLFYLYHCMMKKDKYKLFAVIVFKTIRAY